MSFLALTLWVTIGLNLASHVSSEVEFIKGDTLMNHADARTYCEEKGYQLPIISTIESNEQVTLIMEELGLNQTWLDARIPLGQDWSKNGFRWPNNGNRGVLWHLWAPNEPNNCKIYAPELCVEVRKYAYPDRLSKNLNDFNCDYEIPVLCARYY